MSEIVMLGTGFAMPTECFNTCFVLRTPGSQLLVDAGGGVSVLKQLKDANIPLASIHHLYLTHAHTDHVLGAVWVTRLIMQAILKQKYEGSLHVYGHDKVLLTLKTICELTLPKKLNALFGQQVILHEVKDGEAITIGDIRLTCFDILSTKEKQFGFRALLPDGKVLTCLGDEPFNENNAKYVENADWLLCEAFCLYSDREVFKPYEKHHSTARDAGQNAERLGVRNLLLYHTEDSHLATRKATYTAEAKGEFSGNVFVPDDLETIRL